MKSFLVRACFSAVILTVLYVTSANAQGGVYTVQSGDTLYSIASKYGISVDQLTTVNGLTQNAWIYQGQQLAVPGGGSMYAAPPAPAQPGYQPAGYQTNQTDGFNPYQDSPAAYYQQPAEYTYQGPAAPLPGLQTAGWEAVDGYRPPSSAYGQPSPQGYQPTANYDQFDNQGYQQAPANYQQAAAYPFQPPAANNYGQYSPQDYPQPAGNYQQASYPYQQPMANTYGQPAYFQPETAPNAYPAPANGYALNQEKWIDIDLSRQMLTAYEGQTPVFKAIVSTGAPETPTVVGTYKIYVKHQQADMSGGGDDPYYAPNVPYVMYFHQGYGLHGTYWHDYFGMPVSHGCVNMTIPDAEWIYNWASLGTTVVTRY